MKGYAIVLSNSSQCSGMEDSRTPRVDSLKFVNHTRIENAHKVRKQIFVFYDVAVTCTIIKGREYGLV